MMVKLPLMLVALSTAMVVPFDGTLGSEMVRVPCSVALPSTVMGATDDTADDNTNSVMLLLAGNDTEPFTTISCVDVADMLCTDDALHECVK